MTYRSSTNPFDKTDYSNFAFKKSEILELLRAVNSDFSFEQTKPIAQKNINVSHESSNQNSQYDYRFFLFKKPLLSLHEATCIMTGYSPQYVNQCRNDTNFDHNFANYLGVLDYLGSCVSAQILNYSDQYDEMNTEDFKKFLANDNIFIDGFNNILSTQKSTNFGQPSAQQFEPNIESLNAEITQLRKVVTDKDKTIKELQELINQLESEQPTEQVEDALIGELTGLTRRNQLAQDRQGMARIIALSLWNADGNILIGDMANKVYAIMVDYCRDGLPQTPETIKNWIRPIATPQAQQRGRKPQNQ